MSARNINTDEAVGISALSMALNDVEFPITKTEILDRHGDDSIQWVQDQSETLKSLLKHSDQEKFYSISDLIAAISRPAH